jgi:predicted AAA+ superfamily ATPase
MDIFKLYGLDVGLLAAMADIDPKILLDRNNIMTEFKGAFTEQFVCQQLRVHEISSIYYWSAERGTAEIDFVLQQKNTVIPIEVKAEENLQAKSLKVYMEKFKPTVAVRASLSEYRKTGTLMNIPLYALAAWVKAF